MRAAVFGSGAWGTAIALLLHDNGCNVTLWSKFENEADVLCTTRENPLLTGVKIPEGISITTDIDAAAHGLDAAVLAVPSFALRDTVEALRGRIADDCVVVCMSKGIEKDTSSLFTGIIKIIK